MPRCPSPTTSLGQLKPRRLMSLSTSDQLSVDSLYPGTVLTTTLLPSLRAAITTSTAAFSVSRPALVAPSTHMYTTSRSAGAGCAMGKLIVPLGLEVLADTGAPLPADRRRPEVAFDRPCRYLGDQLSNLWSC